MHKLLLNSTVHLFDLVTKCTDDTPVTPNTVSNPASGVVDRGDCAVMKEHRAPLKYLSASQ